MELVFKTWAPQTRWLSASAGVVQISLPGRAYGRISVRKHGICLNTPGQYFVFDVAFTKGARNPCQALVADLTYGVVLVLTHTLAVLRRPSRPICSSFLRIRALANTPDKSQLASNVSYCTSTARLAWEASLQ